MLLIGRAAKGNLLQPIRKGRFATLTLRGRPGQDGCQSALWDCFGEHIFNRDINSITGLYTFNYINKCPNCLNKCYIFHDREVLRFDLNFSARKTLPSFRNHVLHS